MDQFDWWRAALKAKQSGLVIPSSPPTPEGEDHKPESGYYRRRVSRRDHPSPWEAIAFYRRDGAMICKRQFATEIITSPDAQNAIFEVCSREPISFQVYKAVFHEGAQWPDELEPITDAFGLPPLDDEPENERAVMGHNEPPEKTEVERALAIIAASERQYDEWIKARDLTKLDESSGKLLSQYIARGRELKQTNEKRRAELVEPHVKAQKEINGQWKPAIERCDAFQRRASRDWETYRAAAQRLAEEAARKANEEAQRVADEERKKRAEVEGDRVVEQQPPPPVELVQPTKIKGAVGTRISQRTRTVVVVTDLLALLMHMIEHAPKDLEPAAIAFANRFGASGSLPGVRIEKQTYVA